MLWWKGELLPFIDNKLDDKVFTSSGLFVWLTDWPKFLRIICSKIWKWHTDAMNICTVIHCHCLSFFSCSTTGFVESIQEACILCIFFVLYPKEEGWEEACEREYISTRICLYHLPLWATLVHPADWFSCRSLLHSEQATVKIKSNLI